MIKFDIGIVMRDLIENRPETPADDIVVLVLQAFIYCISSLTLCVENVYYATSLISEDSHFVGHLLQYFLDVAHPHFFGPSEVNRLGGGIVAMEGERVELP